ncbi:MAG: hypothetical protein Q9166_001839 [cf. Caloplaca sp. 2 TL-2023]
MHLKYSISAEVAALSRIATPNPTKAKRGGRLRTQKEPDIAILEPNEEKKTPLSSHDREKLATEIANVSLKALSEAAKLPSLAKTPCRAKTSYHTTSPRSISCSPKAQKSPLQPLCTNTVLIERESRKDSQQPGDANGTEPTSGLCAQAECARLAFSALRIHHARKASEQGPPSFKLENATSTLISKLLALELFEPAVRELRVLKKSLLIALGFVEKAASISDEHAVHNLRTVELLIFPRADIKGPLLAMMVTFQLQVMRLIAAKRDASLHEAATEHLLMKVPYSPVNLIQAQLDPTDPSTHVRIASQLDTLSRIISSMCPGTSNSNEHSGKSRYPDPLTVLRLQMLSLELRSRWWRVAGHKGDAVRDLLDPFSRSLATFRRRCTINPKDGYCVAKEILAGLTSISRDVEPSPAISTPWRQAWRSVYFEMVEVARICSLDKDQSEWLDEYMKLPGDNSMSPCKRCAEMCEMATMYAQLPKGSSSDKETIKAFQNAVHHMKGDLHGSSKELDGLLLAIIRLRKAAGFIINKTRAPPQQDNEAALTSELIRRSYSICLAGVAFLNRYIGKEPLGSAEHQVVRRYQQRLEQASAVARAFIDSVVSIARLSKEDNPDQWSHIETGLQGCLSLAAVIYGSDQHAVPELVESNATSSVFVSVSNTYWLRYVHMKQSNHDAKETLKALESCINAIEHRHRNDRFAAQLQIRLEHYAGALETARGYRKATECYLKAIRMHLEMGNLHKAAAAAAKQSLRTLFARDSQFASLGRVLFAYPRVATKLQSDLPLTTFFDDEQLDTPIRGIALEQQLVSLISRADTRSLETQLISTIQAVAMKLLALYSKHGFPIRRLRIVDSLLWLRTNRSEVLSSGLLDQLMEDRVDVMLNEPQGFDLGLQFLSPFLKASKEAALAIQAECHVLKTQRLRSALATWHHQVKLHPDSKSLEAVVGDTCVWVLHLESLAQHLDAYGPGLLRASVLNLLITVRDRMSPLQVVALVRNLTQCGLQNLRLGHFIKAGVAFHRAHRYINEAAISKEVVALFYVGYAEYFLKTGNIGKCEEKLAAAREIFEKCEKHNQAISIDDRNGTFQLVACVASLCSEVASRQGHSSKALLLARQSLRCIHQAWIDISRRQKKYSVEDPDEESNDQIDGLEDSMAKVTMSDECQRPSGSIIHRKEPMFWDLIPQVHRAFLRVAQLYADEGLFIEAKGYLERSRKFAEAASASGLLSQSLSSLASLMTRSGDYVEADSAFELASKIYDSLAKDQQNVRFLVNLSSYQLAKGHDSAAEKICTVAESMLQRVMATDFGMEDVHDEANIDALQDQLSKITIGKKTTRPPTTTKRVPIKNSGSKASQAVKGPKADHTSRHDVPGSSVAFSSVKSDILHQRIMLALRQGKLEWMDELLAEAATRCCTPQQTVLHAIMAAELSMKRGLDAITSDPVFCVLPESTISLPSILPVGSLVLPDSPRSKPVKAGQSVKRGLNPAGVPKVRRPLPQSSSGSLCDRFREAYTVTSKVFELARTVCSTASLHRLSKLMAETSIMLSALDWSSATESITSSPNALLGITDTVRSLSIQRGQRAMDIEKMMSAKDDILEWPNDYAETVMKRTISNGTPDAASFQKQYPDMIPRSWQVLTMSLSRSGQEIIVSRLRSGQGPFILSMPLDRHSLRDPDEETFGYPQAKMEFQEIIALADQSTHSTQDTSCKGVRSAWWEERAALDARLRDLLANMEHMWFGGFHGIFSPCSPQRDLLSRFQVSFSAVLDNHLPSRQRQGKKQLPKHINLDPRVIELFVALGDPADLIDMEEPLMDLLYFVIDILQFHGERNAYDEVDFDSMTISTLDALRQYHEAAKNVMEPSAIRHTVLILDKELHCFPWESLPCLNNQAVTRLPSLSCLRDRILQQGQRAHQAGSAVNEEKRLCIDGRNGAFVLNPAGDLQATQERFEQSLSERGGWEGLSRSEPREEQMKQYLQERDVFLYFGHGSGNQYIRSRTVQKLDKCAVALLMGCSSGKLTEVGEFEPYGTPMSYMQAGCPAMLATLWNVTDKDIDRFSETVLQKWGLFESRPAPENSPVKKIARSRGKSKARQSPASPPPESGDVVSLDQAVAQGRGSCIFRYLNGAAPVVYGVPVFVA